MLLSTPLFAERFEADRSSSSFELRKNKQRVDTFDFPGEFPLLENIDIDAKRKKIVEFNLNGDYPILETLNYEGGFGRLTGDLTGNLPCLSLVNFLCSNCAMTLDLSGLTQTSCEVNITGMKENIILKLPEDVGLVVHTRTSPKGKVMVRKGLKKQGWTGILKKTYTNELVETAPVVLILNIELTEGRIILN
ncbi:MAG: hypothetical protein S4CHLAM123_06670 [Chlamydiales bacterium]|nr:hypothetical protein [Chlamydiales bacterium]